MKSIVLALTLLTGSLIAGCATTSGGDYCDIARAVRPHKSDVLTDETKRALLTELRKLEKLCGVRP